MTIRVTSILPLPADTVAQLMSKPALLQHVVWPMLRIRGLPETMAMGLPVTVRLYALGVVPLWKHTITVVEQHERQARTEESGGPFRSWRHRLVVSPVTAHTCRYTDEIDIDAGWVTPLARVLATGFYRHRHRRWAALARVLA